MTVSERALIRSFPGSEGPAIAESAWVADGAVVAGMVTVEDRASIWYNTVVRAEFEPVVLGAGSNLQDNVSCHVDVDFPLMVGRGVSVGHGAVLHGCAIEDDVLVGMAATILNGAVVGSGSLVAAGAVVLGGTVIPPRSLVAGVPGKVRREVSDEEFEHIRANAATYLDLTEKHRG